MRQIIGFVLAGLGVPALIGFVLALTKPIAVARLLPFGGHNRGRGATAGITGALSVAIIVPATLLLCLPHFSVCVVPDGLAVAGERSTFTVRVDNAALFAATYRAPYAIDGVKQTDVVLRVSGRGWATAIVTLSESGLEVGRHTLSVGDVTMQFDLLQPATYEVGKLVADPAVAKIGQRVEVTADVSNSGDVGGEFLGALRADGKTVDEQPTEIAAGDTETIVGHYSGSRAGVVKLHLGESATTVTIVKPVRLASGYVLRHATRGSGHLVVNNNKASDGIIVLATASGKPVAQIAVYVRAHSKATVTGVGSGRYLVYYAFGRDWNRTTHDFLAIWDCGRFTGTSSFTASAYRYTVLTLSFGVRDGNAGSTPVSPKDFPSL